MKEAITALEEQVKARITSVENGRKFQNGGRGEAAMPDGAAIFETTGAWEDFSTPEAPDRNRRGTRVSGSGRAAAGPVRDAEGERRAGGEGRVGECARHRASGAQDFVYAQRWLRLDAYAQGRDRSREGSRNGIQSKRLRRIAMGRTGPERGGVDVQAPCVGVTARKNDGVSGVVS
jgi:hypothetical protein